jgi:glutamate synthase domain-containing protein 1
MCGVAGILYRGSPGMGPVGQTLLAMLEVLGSRGVDGTGVAVYGAPRDTSIVTLRLAQEHPDPARLGRIIADLAGALPVRASELRGDYACLVLDPTEAIDILAARIDSLAPGVQVVSAGRSLEILKRVGAARALRDPWLERFTGTHGIGHTRLATESKVDVAHCHPFWARPYADIAVVHNGQITNYHKLRRRMEMRGIRFETENDSEIIGLYVADLLAQGLSLEAALRQSIDDLDGTFTYLISTADAIGLAKDPFATKPIIIAETPAWVALASEEIALSRALGPALRTYQPGAQTVHVWQRQDATAVPAREPLTAGATR